MTDLPLGGTARQCVAPPEQVSFLLAVSSAAPKSPALRDFRPVLHVWGMTETSPIATLSKLHTQHFHLPKEEQLDRKLKQGRAVFGVEIGIRDDANKELPHDGKAFGDLVIRGPWVAQAYYRMPESERADGWFFTGDVATIDEQGWMQITDRSKDVIKSGGEWISSIEPENHAMAHPDILEAAVIGVSRH
jgi:3-(methylthio)propionyl---CoA ligase